MMVDGRLKDLAQKTDKTPDGPAVKQKRERRTWRTLKLSRTATPLISKAMRSKGFAEAEIVTRWSTIAGPELSSATVPVRLRFPRGERMNAILLIRCPSAFAPLLEHQAPRIIEQVNRYFGYRAVAKISVQHGPIAAKPVRRDREKKALSEGDVRNLNALVGSGAGELSPLRAAVKSLGEYVLSNKEDNDKK